MLIDPWIPVGFIFPEGEKAKPAILAGENWQIYEINARGRVLVANETLGKHWIESGLLPSEGLKSFNIGPEKYFALSSKSSHALYPISTGKTPVNKNEAIACAEAFRLTREIDKKTPLQDSIYVEKYSRLLPTYSILDSIGDDIVLGAWLSGGVPVSIHSTRRIHSLTSWLPQDHLQDVLNRSGIISSAKSRTLHAGEEKTGKMFSLPGRAYLEHFFNEHVIDIVQNQERYKALGINFPSAIILHGPPGCGKTFAVEKLVEYLDWPSYQIEASSVASPYIHETSRRIADVFETAMEQSPSVIVIDEMDAFLADRQAAGSQKHSVEEISEFLRRIPEATKNNVLIVGMTNRIDAIDSAILRRGRFDHVIKVEMASEQEINDLLLKLLSALPHEPDIQVSLIAQGLAGRPLSDVAYVVREGGRLAARAGKNKLDQVSLDQALKAAPSRDEEATSSRRIGFQV